MIVCAWIPRFELAVAAGGRAAMAGPLALAPQPGNAQVVGEVSGAAEADGVRPGMALGEALARCPRLALVAPDPQRVGDAWEAVLRSLEGVGAAVETEHAGVASFDGGTLLGLYAGSEQRMLGAVRGALEHPARLGVAPTRFCALAAARRARPRRAVTVTGGRAAARHFLRPEPVSLLRLRAGTRELVAPLERLGIRTLGRLAALERPALTDRFGAAGALAHRLACGEDDPPRPRRATERVSRSLELAESADGPALERALGALIDQLLAGAERRGRTLRTVVLSATLASGGTWRERVALREALADPERLRLALAPRLALLPAPAEQLRLEVERFGPAGGDQRTLLSEPIARRQARLREAVRQTRAAAGERAALRVVCVEPGSRVPERRAVLAPFQA
ncbi:MAG: hypothetical protein E6G56_10055 [Actinobacteria bacterium]|nr:MAG: hypothetical protein E6G56_10055 [Actinomycetota bacterium]